jgi:hypothetical protein
LVVFSFLPRFFCIFVCSFAYFSFSSNIIRLFLFIFLKCYLFLVKISYEGSRNPFPFHLISLWFLSGPTFFIFSFFFFFLCFRFLLTLFKSLIGYEHAIPSHLNFLVLANKKQNLFLNFDIFTRVSHEMKN